MIEHHDRIHRTDPMAKRRVMHEQEHRAGTLIELLFEPRKALGTIATRVGPGRFGIEKQATALRCLAARLHKSVLIPRNLWETTGKGRRIIMVADHQHQWHRQAADLGFKGGIGIRVAPMGQIAGDDGEIRIPMFGVDTVHGQREAAGWVMATCAAAPETIPVSRSATNRRSCGSLRPRRISSSRRCRSEGGSVVTSMIDIPKLVY